MLQHFLNHYSESVALLDSKQKLLVCSKVKITGHVRYINILAWLRGLRDKLLYLVLFSLYSSLFWELRYNRNFKKLQFWPESLGAMLEYIFIYRTWPIENCISKGALLGDENCIELRDRSHLCYKSIINYDLDVTNIFGRFPSNSLFQGFQFSELSI